MTTEPSPDPRDVITRIILGTDSPIDHTGSSEPIVRAIQATNALLAAIETNPAVADAIVAGRTEPLLAALTRAGASDAAASSAEDCKRCGGPNVIWAAASPLWNYVVRGNDINGTPIHDDLVCMPCFVHLAVAAGLPAHGWRLTLHPEPEGLTYTTPSGRTWDPERFQWREAT